eukprot:1905025-Pyramimonas_sp.AAC.1
MASPPPNSRQEPKVEDPQLHIMAMAISPRNFGRNRKGGDLGDTQLHILTMAKFLAQLHIVATAHTLPNPGINP